MIYTTCLSTDSVFGGGVRILPGMLLSKDGNIPSTFISCQKVSYCIVNNKYFCWDMRLCVV